MLKCLVATSKQKFPSKVLLISKKKLLTFSLHFLLRDQNDYSNIIFDYQVLFFSINIERILNVDNFAGIIIRNQTSFRKFVALHQTSQSRFAFGDVIPLRSHRLNASTI